MISCCRSVSSLQLCIPSGAFEPARHPFPTVIAVLLSSPHIGENGTQHPQHPHSQAYSKHIASISQAQASIFACLPLANPLRKPCQPLAKPLSACCDCFRLSLVRQVGRDAETSVRSAGMPGLLYGRQECRDSCTVGRNAGTPMAGMPGLLHGRQECRPSYGRNADPPKKRVCQKSVLAKIDV